MSTEVIEHFTKEFSIEEFKPYAIYNKHLDCIRVVISNCSVTEHRIDELFTLLENNYPSVFEDKWVGFNIKGIRHLFKELDLPLEGVYRVVDLLDEIVSNYPRGAIANVLEVVLARCDDASEISVDLNEEEYYQAA